MLPSVFLALCLKRVTQFHLPTPIVALGAQQALTKYLPNAEGRGPGLMHLRSPRGYQRIWYHSGDAR